MKVGWGEGPRLVRVDSGSYVCPDDPGEMKYGAGRGLPRVSITDAEGALLAELVSGLEVLEIGTGLGVSTQWMANTAKRVYTVDIDEWVWRAVWPGLAEQSNVVTCSSVEQVPKVGAAFIDGCHLVESVERDTREAMRHVGAGGVLIFHDTNANWVKEGIGRVVPLELVELFRTEHGIGVYRRGEG